jgi:phage terminase large subunit-like protein
MKQTDPIKFFSKLKWIDERALTDVIESYRRDIFERALYAFDGERPKYNLVLTGRAKKNWKSADLILAALYRLLAWKSPGGNQCYALANDLDQANDNLELAKKIVEVNPPIRDFVTVKQNVIERKDGKGFFEILPAGDVVGSHGKTYLFCGFDEIHGYKTWDIIEALQPDPTRPDALQWITSYASIFHRPGVSLFDLMATGKRGADPRMLFS